jgi:hypothetical protein
MDENRWLYLNNFDDAALIAEREATNAEIDRLNAQLKDPYVSSTNKSEIENDDLPYEEQKLEALEALIKERGLEKSR